ncbi:hypothetical protein JW962_02530 [Candidatus Dojkabacteria bacterium]|nr:hypothetical protein [Candidatus Dojkabacteria bacterium]
MKRTKPQITQYLVATAVLLFGIVSAKISSDLIQTFYPNRPILPDLLFDIFGYIQWTEWLTDVFWISSLLCFLFYLQKNKSKFSYYVFLFGAIYLIRSFMVILSPPARPTGNGDLYSIGVWLNYHQHGMIPSGHMASITLMWMLIDKKSDKRLKSISFFALIGEFFTLIWSQGHYSIDIATGILLAYFIGTIFKGTKVEKWFLG